MQFSRASSKEEEVRILLTGATGQVGGDLLPLLQSHGQVSAPNRDQLDLSSEAAIRAFVRETKPHWIVNPAAYTAVDAAERETELAKKINTDVPRILGEEAVQLGAGVIHFSTDYVFDGSGDRPWTERDATAPLNVYGETKLAGEMALAGSGAAYLIFRTSWVYGTRGKNFMLTMLRLGKEREQLRVVADQFGAPTLSSELAKLASDVILKAEKTVDSGYGSRIEFLKERQGLFHASAEGATSWFGFAEEILRLAAVAEPNQRWASVMPIRTSDYPTDARRPLNSRLDCTHLADLFSYRLPPWQRSTGAAITELFGLRKRSS